ncbi:hypothetical protein ACQKGD_20705, partial [Peribacillus frigoritolerans]|uniref:hypothetical protein n=1 Tax=Peribacillus frigoritolerans TaxID=450367 RepID=UPI003D05E5E2
GKIKRPESDTIPNSDLRNCLNYMSNFIGSDQFEEIEFACSFFMDCTIWTYITAAGTCLSRGGLAPFSPINFVITYR